MASFRERKNASGKSRWHAQIRVQGHEPQTRSFDRKTDAKAWAEETERLIRAGRFRVVNESQTRDFSELCERFKAKYLRPSRAKDYVQILDWWEMRLNRLRLINITSEIIQGYLNELMASPCNARRKKSVATSENYPTPVHAIFRIGSVQLIPPLREKPAPSKPPKLTSVGTGLRYLAVLSRVFTVAVRQLAWLDRSPVVGVERPRHEETKAPRVLSPAEEKKLLREADASDNRCLHIVARIALRTGMRLNEIMRLRWNDIEFHEGHALLLVKKAKNKRQRFVPLVGDALEVVVRLRVPRGDVYSEDLLFPSKKNLQKPVLIRAAWNTCLKKASIERFRFHDLRHTLASRLAGQNFSLPRIGNVLGHVDHRSTLIYTHFASDDAVQMVAQSAQMSVAAVAKLNASPALNP
jgi:integrase